MFDWEVGLDSGSEFIASVATTNQGASVRIYVTSKLYKLTPRHGGGAVMDKNAFLSWIRLRFSLMF